MVRQTWVSCQSPVFTCLMNTNILHDWKINEVASCLVLEILSNIKNLQINIIGIVKYKQYTLNIFTA